MASKLTSSRSIRAILCIMGIFTLFTGSFVTSAVAAKSKKIQEKWTAEALTPYPLGYDTCDAAPGGSNKVMHTLKTPGRGTLTVIMDDFIGDWDLYVFDADGRTLASSTSSVGVHQEKVTIILASMPFVTVEACNFLGSSSAQLRSLYIYTEEK